MATDAGKAPAAAPLAVSGDGDKPTVRPTLPLQPERPPPRPEPVEPISRPAARLTVFPDAGPEEAQPLLRPVEGDEGLSKTLKSIMRGACCLWNSPLKIVVLTLLLTAAVYMEVKDHSFVEAALLTWPPLTTTMANNSASLWLQEGNCYAGPGNTCTTVAGSAGTCDSSFDCALYICEMARTQAPFSIGMLVNPFNQTCLDTPQTAKDRLSGLSYQGNVNSMRVWYGICLGALCAYAAIYVFYLIGKVCCDAKVTYFRVIMWGLAAIYIGAKIGTLVFYYRARRWVVDEFLYPGADSSPLPLWYKDQTLESLHYWIAALIVELIVAAVELLRITELNCSGEKPAEEEAVGSRGINFPDQAQPRGVLFPPGPSEAEIKLQADLDALRAAHKRDLDGLNKQLEEQRTLLGGAQEQGKAALESVASLRSAVTGLESAKANAESLLQGSQASLTVSADETAKLREAHKKDLADRDRSLADLRKQLTDANGTIAKRDEAAAKAQADIDALKARVASLQATVDEAGQAVRARGADSDMQLAALNGQIKQLADEQRARDAKAKEREAELNKHLVERNAQIDGLGKEKADLTGKVSALEGANGAKERELHSLADRIKHLEADLKRAQDDLAARAGDLAAKAASIADLETRLKELNEESGRKTGDIDAERQRLMKLLEEKKTELAQTQTKLSSALKEKEALDAEIAKLREELAKALAAVKVAEERERKTADELAALTVRKDRELSLMRRQLTDAKATEMAVSLAANSPMKLVQAQSRSLAFSSPAEKPAASSLDAKSGATLTAILAQLDKYIAAPPQEEPGLQKAVASLRALHTALTAADSSASANERQGTVTMADLMDTALYALRTRRADPDQALPDLDHGAVLLESAQVVAEAIRLLLNLARGADLKDQYAAIIAVDSHERVLLESFYGTFRTKEEPLKKIATTFNAFDYWFSLLINTPHDLVRETFVHMPVESPAKKNYVVVFMKVNDTDKAVAPNAAAAGADAAKDADVSPLQAMLMETYSLSASDMKSAMAAFASADKDNDGQLSHNEAVELIVKLVAPTTEAEGVEARRKANVMVNNMDKDLSGAIELDELLEVYAKLHKILANK